MFILMSFPVEMLMSPLTLPAISDFQINVWVLMCLLLLDSADGVKCVKYNCFQLRELLAAFVHGLSEVVRDMLDAS